MIAFDFSYHRPLTAYKAVELFGQLREQQDKAMFYSGGTEFITDARKNKVATDAVIDIKGIPECHTLEFQGDQLIIGAAVSLNRITDSGLFPLLGQTVKKIADHTSRNKITIGGNINSELMYKESILPLLLVDAQVKVLKNEKREEIVPLDSVFHKQIKLPAEGLLLQMIVDKSYIDLPYICLKRTKLSKVGYPIVSIAAIVKDKQIRVAFSGVCDYPFRSTEMESILNDLSVPLSERLEAVVTKLPSVVVDDIQASQAYRIHVFKNMLQETMEGLKMSE